MSNLAKITKKYVIRTQMQTLAPIRIASGMDDGITDIIILKNKQGKPFIPGTSLAGVLRSAVKAVYGDKAVDALFGYAEKDDGQQSMLNISDIVLENSRLIYRDGVAIDSFRGVGKDGAKYDYEALDRGAYGELYIEITVRGQQQTLDKYLHDKFAAKNDVYGELAATVADLLADGISVGSLTSKGFGLIGSQRAELHCFDFAAGDAKAWLSFLSDGHLPAPVYVGDGANIAAGTDKAFIIEAEFAVNSSLIIRDYDRAQELNDANKDADIKDEKSVTKAAVQMKSGDDVVIPGSSIKGVLRNHAKRIAMCLNGGAEKQADCFINAFMGFADAKTARKSRLKVEESYISSKELQEHTHSRNRIDRFTGGTIDGALFSVDPVWQQNKDLAPLKLHLSVDCCTEAEAGLMLLLLKDLWLGVLPIGGDKSIGRGTLSGRSCKIFYDGQAFGIKEGTGFKVDGDKARLEQYVQAFVQSIKEMAVK